MHALFTIEPGHPDVFRYVLRRSDGDVLVTSEAYPTAEAARQGIQELRRCVDVAEIEEHDHAAAQGRRVGAGPERTIGPDEASTS